MNKIVKTIFVSFLGACCSVLIFLADIATSTTTLGLWYEPECPKELQK